MDPLCFLGIGALCLIAENFPSFNEWLEQMRHDEGKGHSHSWFNLFAEVDEDHSGYITYDEFVDVIRHKLHKGTKTLSETTIALPADTSLTHGVGEVVEPLTASGSGFSGLYTTAIAKLEFAFESQRKLMPCSCSF